MKRSYQYILGILFVVLMVSAGLFLRFTQIGTNHQVIELIIEQKQLVHPESPIVVKQGKEVTFLIRGDEDEQFHLEGYHAFVSYKAGQVTRLEFGALTPGTFSLVLDKSKTYIGELVVN